MPGSTSRRKQLRGCLPAARPGARLCPRTFAERFQEIQELSAMFRRDDPGPAQHTINPPQVNLPRTVRDQRGELAGRLRGFA